MYEAHIKIECEDPELVKKSLEPDIENSETVKTDLKTDKGSIEIKIESKKLSYLKAIINSYISLISVLKDAEKIK